MSSETSSDERWPVGVEKTECVVGLFKSKGKARNIKGNALGTDLP